MQNVDFEPCFLPTAIGSLPYQDPVAAVSLILELMPEGPFWPQLPAADWREGMMAQYVEGLPGAKLLPERHQVILNIEEAVFGIEEVERAYREGDTTGFGISPEFARGFHELCRRLEGRSSPRLVKGHVTGPVTLALGLETNFEERAAIYEPDLARLRVQFLFEEGTDRVFMDQETYEQHNVPRETLGDAAVWMTDGFELELLQYNGRIINVDLPGSVSAVISTVESGARGDTASGKVTARATLENGVVLQVPTFIKEGTRVKVDPTTNTYLSRE